MDSYSPWGRKESDMTERLSISTSIAFLVEKEVTTTVFQTQSPEQRSERLAYGGHKPRSICAVTLCQENLWLPKLICDAFRPGKKHNRLRVALYTCKNENQLR